MITVTILTKNDIKITYKNVDHYSVENDDIFMISVCEPDSDCNFFIHDRYKFKDIKGIIIKKKGAKNAG